MKPFSVLTLFMLTVALGICSCSKEGPQGPAGPQGEQGVAGEPGATGSRGPQGKKGDRGTANVIYSNWTTIRLTRQGNQYVGSIYAPKLSQTILDHGTVGVYMRTNTLQGSVYTALDYYYISPSDGSTVLNYIVAHLSVQKITIYSDNDFTNSSFTETSFRYVLIPGGVAARQSAPLPDLTDYAAVCTYYGISQ